MKPNLINMIPALEGEELVYLQSLTRELTEDQLVNFIAVYNGKRKKTDQILLGCVLGFVLICRCTTFYDPANRYGASCIFSQVAYVLSAPSWIQ
jgi:hypothetical protein